jgi:hypothetical protein
VLQLRKCGLQPEQAAVVLELCELRQRARAKFDHPDALFLTRRSYEQASGEALAARKVDLLKSSPWSERCVVLDLCCGCGGDLLTWARHFPVIGVDRDPSLAHFATVNLELDRAARWGNEHSAPRGETSPPTDSSSPPVEAREHRAPALPALVLCADVTTLLPPIHRAPEISHSATLGTLPPDWRPPEGDAPAGREQATGPPTLADWLAYLPPAATAWATRHGLLAHRVVWHLDPDRRDERGRHVRLEDLSPGQDFVAALLSWAGAGFLKLAPATQLAPDWFAAAHWQWLGADRECKQLLGCFGLGSHWPPASRAVAVYQNRTAGWCQWRPEDIVAWDPADPRPGGPSLAPAVEGALPRTTEPVGRTSAPLQIASQPLAWLYEPHAAVYAARQSDAFAAAQGWQKLVGGDYYTADREPLRSPLFAAFRVLTTLPLRTEKVAAWLKAAGQRVTEIKSRSVPEDTRQPLLKLAQRRPESGSNPVSLLLYRQPKPSGYSVQVAVCQRLGESIA